MKTHKMINGQLLNMNKRFSDLSKKQQDFIKGLFREKYKELSSLKLKHSDMNDFILSSVNEEIENLGIWLPYHELKKAYYSYKNRLYKKTDA